MLRYEVPGWDSTSITLTDSLKNTRNTSSSLLSLKLLELVKLKFNFYNLDINSAEIFIMSRPWLSEADFNVPLEIVNDIIEKNLTSENNLKHINPAKYNLPVKNKMSD